MKKLVLAMALASVAFGSNAQESARWQSVGDTHDARIYVDKESIGGGWRKPEVWVKRVYFKELAATSVTPAHRVALLRYRIDCDAQTAQTVKGIYYGNQEATESVGTYDPAPLPEPRLIVPESMIEGVFNAVCVRI